MLKHILNDSVTLKPVIGSDEYNLPLFGNSKTVKCKIESTLKIDSSPNSCKQSYPFRMFCYEKMNVNDVITYQNNDYKIIQVNFYKDLDDKPMFYEVFML